MMNTQLLTTVSFVYVDHSLVPTRRCNRGNRAHFVDKLVEMATALHLGGNTVAFPSLHGNRPRLCVMSTGRRESSLAGEGACLQVLDIASTVSFTYIILNVCHCAVSCCFEFNILSIFEHFSCTLSLVLLSFVSLFHCPMWCTNRHVQFLGCLMS